MLRPKALADSLRQVVNARLPAALLLLPDGALIASATYDLAYPAPTVAAIVADAWKSYTQRAPALGTFAVSANANASGGASVEPTMLMVECTGGKLLVQRLGKLLLCLVGVDGGEGGGALLGDLRYKAKVLTRHLEAPLSKVQF